MSAPRTIFKIWDRTIGRVLVAILISLIRIYQLTISKLIGPVCRYYPSCSSYGLEAIKVHGAGKGSLLSAWRILRCNPWSAGGIDEVPTRGSWPRKENKVIESSTKISRQVI